MSNSGVAGCTLDRAPVLAFTSRYRTDQRNLYTHMMFEQHKVLDATGKAWLRLTAESAPAELGKVLETMLRETNDVQVQAEKATEQLVTGETDNVHDVMLAMAKADVSFRMMLNRSSRGTVHNRLEALNSGRLQWY